MKIAIMQPYFIPYAGYFRLFCASDLFVVYDCVQFPRRSWVHRNKLKTQSDLLDWLTMPLQKKPMNTAIKDLTFRDNAQSEWIEALNCFEALRGIEQKYPELYSIICNLQFSPCEYIVNCLREICRILAIPFNITYSATLGIPADVAGQDRILQIVRQHQATEYINAPGGRELYENDVFDTYGIKLRFLPDYDGNYQSIIQCLAEREPQHIRDSLYRQL